MQQIAAGKLSKFNKNTTLFYYANYYGVLVNIYSSGFALICRDALASTHGRLQHFDSRQCTRSRGLRRMHACHDYMVS